MDHGGGLPAVRADHPRIPRPQSQSSAAAHLGIHCRGRPESHRPQILRHGADHAASGRHRCIRPGAAHKEKETGAAGDFAVPQRVPHPAGGAQPGFSATTGNRPNLCMVRQHRYSGGSGQERRGSYECRGRYAIGRYPCDSFRRGLAHLHVFWSDRPRPCWNWA